MRIPGPTGWDHPSPFPCFLFCGPPRPTAICVVRVAKFVRMAPHIRDCPRADTTRTGRRQVLTRLARARARKPHHVPLQQPGRVILTLVRLSLGCQMKIFSFSLLTDVRRACRLLMFSVKAVRLHFIGHKGFSPAAKYCKSKTCFTPRVCVSCAWGLRRSKACFPLIDRCAGH